MGVPRVVADGNSEKNLVHSKMGLLYIPAGDNSEFVHLLKFNRKDLNLNLNRRKLNLMMFNFITEVKNNSAQEFLKLIFIGDGAHNFHEHSTTFPYFIPLNVTSVFN